MFVLPALFMVVCYYVVIRQLWASTRSVNLMTQAENQARQAFVTRTGTISNLAKKMASTITTSINSSTSSIATSTIATTAASLVPSMPITNINNVSSTITENVSLINATNNNFNVNQLKNHNDCMVDVDIVKQNSTIDEPEFSENNLLSCTDMNESMLITTTTITTTTALVSNTVVSPSTILNNQINRYSFSFQVVDKRKQVNIIDDEDDDDEEEDDLDIKNVIINNDTNVSNVGNNTKSILILGDNHKQPIDPNVPLESSFHQRQLKSTHQGASTGNHYLKKACSRTLSSNVMEITKSRIQVCFRLIEQN